MTISSSTSSSKAIAEEVGGGLVEGMPSDGRWVVEGEGREGRSEASVGGERAEVELGSGWREEEGGAGGAWEGGPKERVCCLALAFEMRCGGDEEEGVREEAAGVSFTKSLRERVGVEWV